jgi:hypothetical protein
MTMPKQPWHDANIVNDPELLDEYLKAYHIAAPYRAKVQAKKDILTHKAVVFVQSGVIAFDSLYSGTLLNADTGFIHPDLRG